MLTATLRPLADQSKIPPVSSRTQHKMSKPLAAISERSSGQNLPDPGYSFAGRRLLNNLNVSRRAAAHRVLAAQRAADGSISATNGAEQNGIGISQPSTVAFWQRRPRSIAITPTLAGIAAISSQNGCERLPAISIACRHDFRPTPSPGNTAIAVILRHWHTVSFVVLLF